MSPSLTLRRELTFFCFVCCFSVNAQVDKTAYKGKLDYVPVRRKGYWEVELEQIAFGDEVLELEGTGAAIDTGTSLVSSFALVHSLLSILVADFGCLCSLQIAVRPCSTSSSNQPRLTSPTADLFLFPRFLFPL